MPGQLTLAESLKQQGMDAAAGAAGAWKETWYQAIGVLAAIGEPFTSDQVREIAGDPWDHVNAVGSLFHRAAREGLIRKVGYRESTRAALHRHPLTVWIGVESTGVSRPSLDAPGTPPREGTC